MQRVLQAILSKADILRYGIGLLAVSLLLLFLWPGLAQNLFALGSESQMFMPHYECYLKIPTLIWLHLSSDMLIGLSYVSISFTLAYLVYRARRDIPFHWVFLAFGLFIIACGGTHFMEVWTTWNATYWLSGYVKLVTAVASVATAVVLPPLVPRTLALVQSAKLSEERRQKLEAAHEELEMIYDRDLEGLANQLAARNRELQASEERYRSLADAMPQIVWTARADGWLDYYNQRWVDYTGLTLEETQGWGWQPVLHPEDAERCLKQWARCVQTGETYQIEYRFRRASDGQYRWHLGRALPMRDEQGNILKWFGTCTDIDDQKRVEAERNLLLAREQTARLKAEEANRAKDEFLATLSHELRTPLTPIIGWVHMIRSGGLRPQDLTHGLAVIDKNSQSLARIINDLLDMSAILSGKMRIEQAPVPLRIVLEEAVEAIRPHADKRAVSLELSDNQCLDAAIQGDRTRLIQVFTNLLHNAVKFSHEGGRVTLQCESGERDLTVRVRDEGLGISPEFLPHVFERFRQADSSMTRSHGGLGIGLALVKSFVEAHGGTVLAESDGHGSCFTVRLPRLVSPVTITPLTPARLMVRPEERELRVLVIEDAADTLQMLQVLLETNGYKTVLCSEAAEALRQAETTTFDLIISDIGMPGMSGLELIKRLRALSHLRDVPAIALTGHAMQKDAESALAAGFDAHIAKPVEPAGLALEVEKLVQRRVQREIR